MKEAMLRKAFRHLSIAAKIIVAWDLDGNFVSHLMSELNKTEEK
tara:strand:- start:3169 stop:3300 length:132 start_codon:yes stop_codon:yes gene_type:complete